MIKWIKESGQTLLVNKINIATELVSENTTLRQSMDLIDQQMMYIQIGKNGLGYDDEGVVDLINEFKEMSEPFFETMEDIYLKVYKPTELPLYDGLQVPEYNQQNTSGPAEHSGGNPH